MIPLHINRSACPLEKGKDCRSFSVSTYQYNELVGHTSIIVQRPCGVSIRRALGRLASVARALRWGGASSLVPLTGVIFKAAANHFITHRRRWSAIKKIYIVKNLSVLLKVLGEELVRLQDDVNWTGS